MEEELKEMAELLEEARDIEAPSCKKYIKLILPHVILVAVVCLYAVVGAWVFYSLESPHEDKLKKIGMQKIGELRKELVEALRMKRKELKKTEVHNWARITDMKLQIFNEYLYRAFKEHYVRYADIRIYKTNIDKRSSNTKGRRYRRKSKHRSKLMKSEKQWTANSAIFFAATTMATIGYGNIVPVTPHGRIACVIFALFGVPLAIITIGDLGKFLSECTIWLYNKMKKCRSSLKRHFIQCKPQNTRQTEMNSSEKATETVITEPLDWNDLALDKTEVPLIFVFAILLLYIAFGGVLFASFETWSYMDAFYFCFVSLTTIGFGDFVPENHEYILLMLVYLGFGLGVTTMCIDLVGIQYIQKIHYFGRKFRGTDLLQLLKRRHLIERGLDQGDELLKLYFRRLQEGATPMQKPKWHTYNDLPTLPVPSNYDISDNNNNGDIQSIEIHKLSNVNEEQTSLLDASANLSLSSSLKTTGFREETQFQKLSKSTSNDQITDAPSTHSLSAEVSLKETYPQRSKSIESLNLIFPSEQLPNLKLIVDDAKNSQKLPEVTVSKSPTLLNLPPSQSSLSLSSSNLHPSKLSNALISPSTSPIGLACMMSWDSYIKMLSESDKPFAKPVSIASEEVINDTIMMTVCENDEELIQEDEAISYKNGSTSESPQSSSLLLSELSPSYSTTHITELFKLNLAPNDSVETALLNQNAQQSISYYQNIPIHSIQQTTVETENALQNLLTAPESIVSHKLPPAVVDDNYCFIIDGETIGSEAMLHDDIYWSHTSRPTQYFFSDDLRHFHRVNCIKSKGKIIAVKLIGSHTQKFSTSSRSSIGLNLSTRSTPVHQPRERIYSIPSRSVSSISGFRNDTKSLTQVYVVTRIYSFWKTCPSFRRIVTLLDRVLEDDVECLPPFQKRIFVQHIWRNTKSSDKERVKSEFAQDYQKHFKRKTIRSSSKKHAFS